MTRIDAALTTLLCAVLFGLNRAWTPSEPPRATLPGPEHSEPIDDDRTCTHSWVVRDEEGAPLPDLELRHAGQLLGTTDASGLWAGEAPCNGDSLLLAPGKTAIRLGSKQEVTLAVDAQPLEVHIQHPDGAPAGGITVVISQTWQDFGASQPIATSDEDGVARFTVALPLEFQVEFDLDSSGMFPGHHGIALPGGTLTYSTSHVPEYTEGVTPRRMTMRLPNIRPLRVHAGGLPEDVRVETMASCGWIQESRRRLGQLLECPARSQHFWAWSQRWAIPPQGESVAMDLSDLSVLTGTLRTPTAYIHALRPGMDSHDSVSAPVAADGRFSLPGLYAGRWQIAATDEEDPPYAQLGEYLGITVEVGERTTKELGTIDLRAVK